MLMSTEVSILKKNNGNYSEEDICPDPICLLVKYHHYFSRKMSNGGHRCIANVATTRCLL